MGWGSWGGCPREYTRADVLSTLNARNIFSTALNVGRGRKRMEKTWWWWCLCVWWRGRRRGAESLDSFVHPEVLSAAAVLLVTLVCAAKGREGFHAGWMEYTDRVVGSCIVLIVVCRK